MYKFFNFLKQLQGLQLVTRNVTPAHLRGLYLTPLGTGQAKAGNTGQECNIIYFTQVLPAFVRQVHIAG